MTGAEPERGGCTVGGAGAGAGGRAGALGNLRSVALDLPNICPPLLVRTADPTSLQTGPQSGPYDWCVPSTHATRYEAPAVAGETAGEPDCRAPAFPPPPN